MSDTRLRLVFGSLLALFVVSGCNDSTSPASDGGKGDAMVADAAPKGPVCKQDADCDDGLYCNGPETCVAGSCAAGAAIACDDGIGCTIDKCSERTHTCSSAAPDRDGDGHGDMHCADKAGKLLGDDCDDSDALRFPGNIESCDAQNKDDDCNPKTFGDKDSDDDGFIDARCCNAASDAKGAKLNCGNDCDDLKASVNPKAVEVCDRFDNDCDGKTDEGVAIKQYPDADFDGHGQKGAKAVMKCAGSVGFAAAANDCNDKDPEVFEGQFEICDGKDNNCKNGIDEIHQDAPWFTDSDGDGFGDATSTPIYSCERIPGRVLSQSDCDDTKAAIKPSAAELCDGVDNDCNGKRDFPLDVNDFEDDDNDGVADAKCTGGKDCDDTDATTGDGKEEVCDMHDNDCDGKVDEQTAKTIWYLDKDGDGWGTNQGTALARCEPIPGRAASLGDCDDDVNSVHPEALESCNGSDDNCNGRVDEGTDYQCQLDSAVSYCKLGSCAVLSCFPGRGDCNAKASDGCECVAPIVPFSTGSCSVDSDCDDGAYCNGKEHCSAGDCYSGTPVNCTPSASVLQGSVALSSSLDIKKLAGIETITGNLDIDVSGLTTLIGLESLKTIGGNLTVTNNAQLQALVGSGLINLTTVAGDILIDRNPKLTVIRLPSLVNAGSITISRNDALTTLDGFDSLVRVDRMLQIDDNMALVKLSGLQSLISSGDLQIVGNALTTFSLSHLQTLHGDLSMDGGSHYIADALVSMSLPALTTIERDMRFSYLGGLKTISLPLLKSVGGQSIEFYYDTVLANINIPLLAKFGSAASAQKQGSGYFEISACDGLMNLDHMHGLQCLWPDCSAYINNDVSLDNCAAKALLESFTNFSTRSYSYNLPVGADAGPSSCPDMSL